MSFAVPIEQTNQLNQLFKSSYTGGPRIQTEKFNYTLINQPSSSAVSGANYDTVSLRVIPLDDQGNKTEAAYFFHDLNGSQDGVFEFIPFQFQDNSIADIETSLAISQDFNTFLAQNTIGDPFDPSSFQELSNESVVTNEKSTSKESFNMHQLRLNNAALRDG